MRKELSCYCGSAKSFQDCCAPYLAGEKPAPTAEALMRSRYTAYVRKDEPYLLRTWHPKHRPPALRLQQDVTEWLGLTVQGTEAGKAEDSRGTVSFIAECQQNGQLCRLIERSNFIKEKGEWLYLDGTETKVGRNEPCPCHSGKKYKQCCGKNA